jgi:peptidoglycan/LPS O-acetylase OafA/YrhL
VEEIAMVGTSKTLRTGRWQFLDAIRGIAAMAVVLQHILWYQSANFENFFSTVWSPGRFGVVAFFLVSGFIVPRSLEHRGNVTEFWVARFFRLFPPYWFSLLFIGLLPLAGIPGLTPVDLGSGKAWVANLTMMQGFVRIADINPVAWTLGLEMVLYVAITFAYIKGFLKKTWFIAMSLLGLMAVASIFLPLVLHIRFPAGASAVFGAIIAGLALFRWFSGELKKFEGLTIMGLCIVVTIASSFVNYHSVRSTIDFLQPTQFCAILSAITGYGFFLFFLKFRDLKFPAWTLWLGQISYSLYLLHPIALALIPHNGNSFVTVPLQLGLSVVLAWFGYECIEVPSIAMAQKRLRTIARKRTLEQLPSRERAA